MWCRIRNEWVWNEDCSVSFILKTFLVIFLPGAHLSRCLKLLGVLSPRAPIAWCSLSLCSKLPDVYFFMFFDCLVSNVICLSVPIALLPVPGAYVSKNKAHCSVVCLNSGYSNYYYFLQISGKISNLHIDACAFKHFLRNSSNSLTRKKVLAPCKVELAALIADIKQVGMD